MQRLILSLGLTGLGYIATLLYTYTLLAHAEPEAIGRFNQYESVLLIISSLVSLGITQDAARNISIGKHSWRIIYREAQSFRLFASIIISIFSVIIFGITKNEIYLLGISSIAIALSGDFALYAVGRPVAGSLTSLVRQFAFSAGLILIILGFSPDLNITQVWVLWALSYMLSGYLSAKLLSINYFHRPLIPKLQTLKKIGIIAIIVFFYNNIKPAFILLISDRLTATEAAYYFEAFKIYFIIFSIKRVAVQALYKKIISGKNSVKNDIMVATMMTSALIALWSIRSLASYLQISVPIPSRDMLLLITAMTAASSIFPTSFTKLFALQKDILIAIPVGLSALLILTGLSLIPKDGESVKQYLLLLGASELVIGISSFFLLRRQIVKT